MQFKNGDEVLVRLTITSAETKPMTGIGKNRSYDCRFYMEDIEKVVMAKFSVGDSFECKFDGQVRTGKVIAVDYVGEPPQAWVSIDGQWPRRTLLISEMRRQG